MSSACEGIGVLRKVCDVRRCTETICKVQGFSEVCGAGDVTVEGYLNSVLGFRTFVEPDAYTNILNLIEIRMMWWIVSNFGGRVWVRRLLTWTSRVRAASRLPSFVYFVIDSLILCIWILNKQAGYSFWYDLESNLKKGGGNWRSHSL